MAITLYSNREVPYGCFSNFSDHDFELDGQWWPTSEHYFQAMKFVGTDHAETIHQAPDPKTAANLGRTRDVPLRPDWERVKEDVMRAAVPAKFRAHEDIQMILLSTGNELIIEDAPGDYYWGWGRDHSGKNRLGVILMEAREILRKELIGD